MTQKTLSDCATCDHITVCDAHVSGGSWRHAQGIDPCVVVVAGDAE